MFQRKEASRIKRRLMLDTSDFWDFIPSDITEFEPSEDDDDFDEAEVKEALAKAKRQQSRARIRRFIVRDFRRAS
jgi:hypothetical protein